MDGCITLICYIASVAVSTADPGDYVVAKGQPVSVCLLPYTGAPRGQNEVDWSASISELVALQIEHAGRSIVPMPESTIKWATHELQIDSSGALSRRQMQSVAAATGARWVIWGSYQVSSNVWKITTRLLEVATSSESEFTKSTSDLSQALSEIAGGVVRVICRKAAEQPDGSIPVLTKSNKALEAMCVAYAKSKMGHPLDEVESSLRAALSLDPKLVVALESLAHVLILQGKVDEAVIVAKSALEAAPDSSAGHAALGTAYSANALQYMARDELLEAVRLDPNRFQNYTRLSAIYLAQSKWREALNVLATATRLEPFEPAAHATMGLAYLRLNEAAKAAAELNLAEKYNLDCDAAMEWTIATTYSEMLDVPKAIKHLEIFIDKATKLGLASSLTSNARKKLQELQLRQVVHYIQYKPSINPAQAESSDLTSLSPAAGNAAITNWARQLLARATNELDRADKLLAAVVRSSSEDNQAHYRTASETFADWSNPHAAFNCHDLSILYIALARAAGLEASYVLVDRDYAGRWVSHACAAARTPQGTLLIDPTLRWLGVPHKDFEIQSERRMTAIHMASLGDSASEEQAIQLAPDWARLYFLICLSRTQRKELLSAQAALECGLKTDRTSGLALYAQGILEGSQKLWEHAVDHLGQSLALGYGDPLARFEFATALMMSGRPREAEAEYRAYLQGDADRKHSIMAIDALQRITSKSYLDE